MHISIAYFNILHTTNLLNTNIQEKKTTLHSLKQTQQHEKIKLIAITNIYNAQTTYNLTHNTTIIQQDLLHSSYKALETITNQPHPEIKTLNSEFPIINTNNTLIK